MKTSQGRPRTHRRWMVTAGVITLAGAATFVPCYQAGKKAEPQEREASHPPDQGTTLNDQSELAVTVYNSNIALVRDVRQLQLPTGDRKSVV